MEKTYRKRIYLITMFLTLAVGTAAAQQQDGSQAQARQKLQDPAANATQQSQKQEQGGNQYGNQYGVNQDQPSSQGQGQGQGKGKGQGQGKGKNKGGSGRDRG